MNNPTRDEAIRILHDMKEQLFILRRVQQKIHQQHKRRVDLMDQLITECRERNKNLDRLLRQLTADDDGWWKKGEQPPWQT